MIFHSLRRSLLLAALMAFMVYYNGSFAITLGHVIVADSSHGIRDVVYEKQDNYAVVEGDILIYKLAPNSSVPQALILFKLGGDHWPNNTIPFEISENLPLANKLAVLEAMNLWQQNTPVTFIELTSKNRAQYPDYVLFIPTGGTICSSYVGKQGGAQVIKLAPRCNAMHTTHELGHALGLWHEQSRADRDAYIQILWENIEDDYRYNFNQHLSDGQDFGDYDYQSIMHYSPYAFSKNGRKTIIPLQDNVEIGQRERLSNKDIAAVSAIYPRIVSE